MNRYPRTHWVAFGLLLAVLALAAKAETAGTTSNQIRWDGEAFDPTCWTPPPGPKASRSDEIARWIKQLGDAEQEKREEAVRTLTDIGAAARDQLKEATRGSDPEAAARAAAALEAIQRMAERIATKQPLQVFALQLPADVQVYSMWLGLLGETVLPPTAAIPNIQLPNAAFESRSGQIPFFMVMAEHFWHPVPVWVGPRMVQAPEDASHLPARISVELTEYDLLTELDEHWQPTTPRARARVQALDRYLALDGSFNGWMLPMVPVPSWVDTLRKRMAQGDAAAVEMLFNLDAAPSVEDLRQLLKKTQGPAIVPILRYLDPADFKRYVATVQGLLNGRYANDAPMLSMLGEAGVALDPAKLNYPADEIVPTRKESHAGQLLIEYCRRVGLKAPDGLVDRCLKDEAFVQNCGDLLTEAQKDSLRKTLTDQTVPERMRFHARCLLLTAGDKAQEAELLKYFPPGTPYRGGYNSANLEEYIRGTLDRLAADGFFPGRVLQLLKEELFDSDKIGPSVESVLWSHQLTPEQVAELVRKLDRESVSTMAWHLGDWRYRAAVPKLVEALDSWDFGEGNQYAYHKVVYALRECADPASGPCLVRALEKIEKTALHMTPESRLKALEALMRIGADFRGGKASFLREIANERRFSVFRLVALAGLAKLDPVEGLALMLKELDAAPPTVLPMFIELAAATRLPGVVPALKKHLNDHYPPAAMAAAMGALNMGDGTGLPVIHKLRSRYAKGNKTLLSALMSYWKPDTPPEQVGLIRECLDAYAPGKPCRSKAEYRQRFGLPAEEEPSLPATLPENPMWFAVARR